MTIQSKIVIVVLLSIGLFHISCYGSEGHSVFYKRLYRFQKLVRSVESFKPEVKEIPSKNNNIGRIRLDYSDRFSYLIEEEKVWEELVDNFRNFIDKYPDSDKVDDSLFCISSAYLILTQAQPKYYNRAVSNCKYFLEELDEVKLGSVTIKVLGNTSTFEWLSMQNTLESKIVKSHIARALIFLYLKNNDLSLARSELEKMKHKIFTHKEYVDLAEYIDNFSEYQKDSSNQGRQSESNIIEYNRDCPLLIKSTSRPTQENKTTGAPSP